MKKTRAMKLVELQYNKDIVELISEDYTDTGTTIVDLAKKYEISHVTLISWIKKFNITKKSITLS